MFSDTKPMFPIGNKILITRETLKNLIEKCIETASPDVFNTTINTNMTAWCILDGSITLYANIHVSGESVEMPNDMRSPWMKYRRDISETTYREIETSIRIVHTATAERKYGMKIPGFIFDNAPGFQFKSVIDARRYANQFIFSDFMRQIMDQNATTIMENMKNVVWRMNYIIDKNNLQIPIVAYMDENLDDTGDTGDAVSTESSKEKPTLKPEMDRLREFFQSNR